MKNNILLLSASVYLCSTIIGCSSQQKPEVTHLESAFKSSNLTSKEHNASKVISSQFPKTELSDSIAIDSINKKQSIRAQQQLDKGTLVMISNGREEQGHLLVPSVMGQKGDQTFHSDYSIVYRQGDEDKVLLDLPAFQYVQPIDKKLSFEQMDFQEAYIYILTPQYQTGHGVEGYVFAMDKQSEDVFPLEISKDGNTFKTFIYSETESLPVINKNKLVVHPPIGAGTTEEDSKNVHYRIDLKNKQLVAE